MQSRWRLLVQVIYLEHLVKVDIIIICFRFVGVRYTINFRYKLSSDMDNLVEGIITDPTVLQSITVMVYRVFYLFFQSPLSLGSLIVPSNWFHYQYHFCKNTKNLSKVFPFFLSTDL